MPKNKLLCVIVNGKGGVGKDSLVDDYITRLDHSVRGIKYSSINDVKKLAKLCGWEGGKEDKDRKFLSDLKDILTEYNDMPFKSCVRSYKMAAMRSTRVWFCMVREPEEIEKLKNHIVSDGGNCVTLLVRRDGVHSESAYGNRADDEVENYFYDYIFENNKTLEASKYLFRGMINQIYKKVVGESIE